jgi:Spy/CpxP family protein refolding chaperone
MTLFPRALAAATCTFWLSAAVFGQPGAIPAPNVGPFSNPYGRSFQWLANPQVQEELKLTDEQRDKIKQARDEMTQKVRDLYKSQNVNESDFRKRQQVYRERIQALSDEAERKAECILSTSQATRLKQIIRQAQLSWRSDGIVAVLLEKDVSADIRLMDDQRKQLRQEQADLQRERAEKVQEFYRQLQEEARERLFAVLTADQRQKLEALLGPKFELKLPVAGDQMPGPLAGDSKPRP